MKVDLSLYQLITRKKCFLVINNVNIRISKRKFKEIAKALNIKLINPKDRIDKVLENYNICIKEKESEEYEINS